MTPQALSDEMLSGWRPSSFCTISARVPGAITTGAEGESERESADSVVCAVAGSAMSAPSNGHSGGRFINVRCQLVDDFVNRIIDLYFF